MKITIDLTECEVKALKAYLLEVSGDINPKVTRAEIVQTVKGFVNECMQAGAVGDYYNKFCN